MIQSSLILLAMTILAPTMAIAEGLWDEPAPTLMQPVITKPTIGAEPYQPKATTKCVSKYGPGIDIYGNHEVITECQ